MHLFFIGDSFVNGTGDPDGIGWAGRVYAAVQSKGHDLQYYNLGVGGDTSADIAARWEKEVTRRFPGGNKGWLIFSFGVNDTTLENGTPRVHPADSVKNLHAILNASRSWIPAIMIGPPPIEDLGQNSRISLLSNAFATVCGDHKVPYLDIFNSLLNSPLWMSEIQAIDGSHPGAGGYSELAELVQNWESWAALLKQVN